MTDRTDKDSDDVSSDVPPEVAEQLVHQLMDRQYRQTLDQPVGMLGNKTPRQAVKSSSSRQKVGRSHGNLQFRVDVEGTRCSLSA
ncbi:hypothetical protein [Mesorhizobium amorphae]|uniref:hypothetical protein n=1 Tax=Mesorhizobium amorphae TaxID=71433 RepID=UPI0024E086F0|nr:hypothetical protein [Mesorhizobium amorphae]